MSHLILARDGDLVRVTIDRPEKRNALSRAVLEEIRQVFTGLAGDTTIKAALLTGAGEKSFAAGGDLKELEAVREHDEATAFSTDAKAALQAVRDFPAPVIARVNGDALGGGAELALACDLRVLAAHARMGFLQGRLGLTTGWGGGYDLARRVGGATALRLLARGEILSATEAAALSLADAIGADLDATVADFMAPLLAQSAHVLRGFKAITRGAERSLRMETDAVETRVFAEAWVHEDHWRAAAEALKKKS